MRKLRSHEARRKLRFYEARRKLRFYEARRNLFLDERGAPSSRALLLVGLRCGQHEEGGCSRALQGHVHVALWGKGVPQELRSNDGFFG
ncbi:hypothetical protein AMJ71_08870 [candidate division TA06 bacterium SM1_40]|uniref:Uncharacterized protein n=2 Tax=Bacteria division TA06 TaxID=1156500 RepID=A0A0S8JH19_UNCT6|nr:MAG: hypothetical protein AMJ82_03790 [candidate division TA06 bacterium SM23_40]KPL07819.1 MAG: hypothetical protein AMJ71_08870 [candidate division TA06 bacterium SM1_40]